MDAYRIRRVNNGFVVESGANEKIMSTLDEVFDDMLLHYEGRSKTFTRDSYGDVSISREKTS